jgi:hypothetical protein
VGWWERERHQTRGIVVRGEVQGRRHAVAMMLAWLLVTIVHHTASMSWQHHQLLAKTSLVAETKLNTPSRINKTASAPRPEKGNKGWQQPASALGQDHDQATLHPLKAERG